MDLDFNGHIESLDSEFLQLSEVSPLAVLAITPEQRKAALDLLLPYQRADFEGIFRAMDGLPVTIRLLDPPLHELLSEGDVEQIVNELTGDTGMTEEEVYSRIERMSEVNPCLDFAGASIVVIQASHIYVGSNHTTKSDLS